MAKTKTIFLWMLVLLLIGCFGCAEQEPPGNPTSPSDLAEKSKSCGDGVCDGPETPQTCPEDCQETPDAAVAVVTSLPSIPAAPPLHFFYVIHTHTSEQFHPYSDPGQTTIDTDLAENMLAAIEGIAAVLDKYRVKASWQFLPATVKGFHEYQGENNIISQLITNGHEIGVHTHNINDIQFAVQNLEEYIGISPVVTSGFLAHLSNISPGEAKAAMSIAIEAPIKQGLSVGTANLSPGGDKNPLASECQEILGMENDMWPETGNLMFPWRPDYAHQDPCSHNPEGKMLLIDHVSIEWVILPDESKPADVLDERHFTILAEKFNAALDYMADNSPSRTAAWGFVTHITEYAVGGKGENPPSQEALSALEDFLAIVNATHDQKRVIYSTPKQIADHVDQDTD